MIARFIAGSTLAGSSAWVWAHLYGIAGAVIGFVGAAAIGLVAGRSE